jgi:hypothetical protein
MVVLGALVREDCSVESKARVGTIVKVTPLVLSKYGLEQAESDIEQAKKRHAELNREYDPTQNHVIRPGKVFSVRWQHDPTQVTIHVAYDDCNGKAVINLGTNTVEVVK